MGQVMDFGRNVEGALTALRGVFEGAQDNIVITTCIEGTVYSGNPKKGSMLRVPMGYTTDVLKHPDSIPIGARFLGIMLLRQDQSANPSEAESQPNAGPE